MSTIASYHDREKWLEIRGTGIGGSDAAKVLGQSPFGDAHEVWLEKTGQASGEQEITPPMLRGIMLEPIAAQLYEERTGREIRRQPLRRHPEHDFIIGNVDRQIFAGSGEGDHAVESTGVLEIKCPGLQVFHRIKREGLPDYYTIQLMHYLAVYGYSWGSFAIFNAERMDLQWFDIEARPDLIDTIIEKEVAFWTDHVVPEIEPPTDAPASEDLDVPTVEGALHIVDDPEWVELAENMRDARQLKKTAENLEKQAKEEIQLRMKREEVHGLEIPGVARFYYKPMPGRTSWKGTAEAIARKAKLDVDTFIVKGKGYERFMPYFFKPSPGGDA